MFCTKCGQQVEDGFTFCPKCGGKIVDAAATESGNQLQQSENESVTEQSRSKSCVFADRVESSKDKAVNDYLFTLFAKLVKPVKRIEQDESKISEYQDKIEDLKVKKPIHIHYKLLLIIAVALSVLLIIVTQNRLRVMEENPDFQGLVAAYYDNNCSFSNLDCSGINIFDKFFISYAHPNGDSAAVILFQTFLLPPLIFFILGLCAQIILLKAKGNAAYAKALTQIPAIEQQLKDVHEDESKVINAISEYICFCPPSYRSSSALAYFVDSYRNTRVSNLQEAINKYDEYLRHEELINAQMTVCTLLNRIAFNTETLYSQMRDMSNQLSTINTSIWLN